ncbi:MAG TPA: FAD-dependent oxidoreductase [Armatimonadota bacterium]|jgi:NADPH-dependent 2,4-dienoyl-CoA reductase/sulfur reductase-like enzyme/rhodanese-related sulfurtransferase
MAARRIVIVGGVAGGASTAARARRLSEEARITVLERGPHVSFANCGLPYHIGGEIPSREDLLLQTPESLRARFNLDVRVLHEVSSIDREAREVEVRNLTSGDTLRLPYDDLVLSTGAAPVRPPIPGIDRPGLFTLRTVPDTEAILQWVANHDVRTAVVVGGGYIGLEVAEQLHRLGIRIRLAEALPQVMAPIDPEIAAWLHLELMDKGIDLHLSDGVAAFEDPAPGEEAAAATVVLRSGARLPADLVVLGLGVRPESGLARDAGLELGPTGGIRVDGHLRSSDPHIYALGDAIEVRNPVTGDWAPVPLAGPANRQGRVVADNLFGRPSRFEGTWGTAILRLFDLSAGCTGANEKALRAAEVPYLAVHLHPSSHAGYYPGAEPIALKLLFSPESRKVLGAQAVGKDGVDKRIDVIATALKAGLTIDDLADLELAYAPPFGSAKDPVNLAGMAAQNVLNGEMPVAQWHEMDAADPERTVVLDVRSPAERARGYVPGSLHVPLPELRARLDELPRDRELLVYCHSGQRSYFATRVLLQAGFRARNVTGAYRTWSTAHEGGARRCPQA